MGLSGEDPRNKDNAVPNIIMINRRYIEKYIEGNGLEPIWENNQEFSWTDIEQPLRRLKTSPLSRYSSGFLNP
jgi:hypothetical protein